MKRQIITCITALLSLHASAQDDLGVIELKQSGSHLFSTQKLAPKQLLSIVTADGTVLCCYRVGNLDRQKNDQQIDQSPEAAATEAYRLTPSHRTARIDVPTIGIGFPAKPMLSITSRSANETAFTWNGNAYQLKQCTTTEGVQLTLERHGAAVRRYYFYLGYDVEPTCQP